MMVILDPVVDRGGNYGVEGRISRQDENPRRRHGQIHELKAPGSAESAKERSASGRELWMFDITPPNRDSVL